MAFSLAENAFINAVVKSMGLQNELIKQHRELDKVLAGVANANAAVMQDRGMTDATPLDEILAAQQSYLEAAIERSEFDEDATVVKALRQQLAEMQEAFHAYVKAQGAQLGQIQGPVL
jgi:hypothetical protein